MTVPSHRLPPVEWRKEPGLLLTSSAQRKAVFARDTGKCAKCGSICFESSGVMPPSGTPLKILFHADHIIALHAIPPSVPFPEALKYWRIENLQCLCPDDHRKKSAREVTANAKVKRIRRRLDGTRRPRRTVPSRPLRKPTTIFKRTPTKQIERI